jgi:multidrug efflux pump subunit AcrB
MFASVRPAQTTGLVSHDAVQRIIDVQCGVEGRDLGSVTNEIRTAISELGALPPGSKIAIHGQSESMTSSFTSLGAGLVLATILVYLLLVVLFQSWLDPLIIIAAVPGALVGVLWMLSLTGTTLNVESFMGAIMSVGVAVANSILVVSFANDVRATRGLDALAAAAEAGRTRLRPVLMTALAMMLGMIPVALGVGEGGEQNAPLGRAVIGGLLVATFVTLFVVPILYSLLRKKPPSARALDARFDEETKSMNDTHDTSLEIA